MERFMIMKITEVTKKDGSIIYRANIYLGTDAITGKKVKTSVTGRTKKEVKQKAKEAENKFSTNPTRLIVQTDIKNFSELTESWLETYKLTVKVQTLVNTKTILKVHILPVFGEIKLEKISPIFIQTFINRLSMTFVNFKVVHSIIRRILQHGVLLELLPHNPARETVFPKRQQPEKQAIKYIDNQDLKKLLDHMEQLAPQKFLYYYDKVLYNFFIATGCRFGEAIALEWSDIDFENLTVSISKTYNRQLDIVSTPKTKAGTRVISIDKKTALMLKQYRNRQRLQFLAIGGKPPKVVFASTTLLYASSDVRSKALRNRCKEIGIQPFNFHAFRHTHASLLLNAGISYKELQHRLGHSKISMTLDTYGHLSKDKEKESVVYFEKAINSL